MLFFAINFLFKHFAPKIIVLILLVLLCNHCLYLILIYAICMFTHKQIYKLKKQFYVFIFGCAWSSLLWGLFSSSGKWGQLSSCDVQASHCDGFSCCGAQSLGRKPSIVVACGLKRADSVVVAKGLSCSTSCGIFMNQGLNRYPLHWQVDS